jgi:hypothetical protein
MRQCRQLCASLQPFGLWLDEGETDSSGNPIWLIVIFPLNVPKSLARRADVCYPIAYTYAESSIVDCVRYLIPQFIALRKSARMFPLIPNPVFVSLEGISGDFPAVAKVLLRTQVAVANFPCNDCLIENGHRLNDTSRWLGWNQRSQANMMVAVQKMRETKSIYDGNGMREECLSNSIPFFAYFSPQIPSLDCFGVCLHDYMHNLFLGLYKKVGQVLANCVLSIGGAKKEFKRIALELHSQRIVGLNGTLFRPRDIRESSKTDLLHLLANGNLYAREYKELGPLFPYLFHALAIKFPAIVCVQNEAMAALTDLVWMGTFIQRRFWPVNADEKWWNDKREFWIDAYARFQRAVKSDEIGKSKNLIKIHAVICHVWDSLKRHGTWSGTDALEKLFHHFKSMTTNYRNQGSQIFRKFFSFLSASRWVLNNGPLQQAARKIIDEEGRKKQMAGREKMSAEVLGSFQRFLEQTNGDFMQLRCVKWVLLPKFEGGLLERGPDKIFACSSWHSRKVFDCLRLENGEYFQLSALAHYQNKTLGCGKLLTNINLSTLPYNYRFPVLFNNPNATLTVKELDLGEVEVVCLLPQIRNDPQFLHAVHELADLKNVFHHHIFITHGAYRNQREEDWSAGQNGTELWEESE